MPRIVQFLINKFKLHDAARNMGLYIRPAIGKDPLPLERKHIRNCRLVEGRDALLEFMPKNSVCAEIGIATCNFSRQILTKTRPRKLHLVEIFPPFIENAGKEFPEQVASGQVELHQGNSSEIINSFKEGYFDWIFIDADHSYPFVRGDLEAARKKMKKGGLILLHDYVTYDYVNMYKYGVVDAVNEFCIKHGYEIVFFALETHMYNTVALRKIKS